MSGVLVSGKGTRFILANTEQLHAKIHEMSERIRNLEEALEQCRCIPTPHPLLTPELLTIKSTMGLYGGTQSGTDNPIANTSNGQVHTQSQLNGNVNTNGRATEETEDRKLDIELTMTPSSVIMMSEDNHNLGLTFHVREVMSFLHLSRFPVNLVIPTGLLI